MLSTDTAKQKKSLHATAQKYQEQELAIPEVVPSLKVLQKRQRQSATPTADCRLA